MDFKFNCHTDLTRPKTTEGHDSYYIFGPEILFPSIPSGTMHPSHWKKAKYPKCGKLEAPL
jgi:hypothetical protein